MITVTNIQPSEVAYLDKLLLQSDGRLRLLPLAAYTGIPHEHLRLWAMLHGRYLLPTAELVSLLKGIIGLRSAIEICAGCGDLGFRLGIPMTDSYQQISDPVTMLYYASLGQKPTVPLPDVERLDAESAVRKYKPQVVIGSWVTEKWTAKAGFGNYLGPREHWILRRCEMYVMLGNAFTHEGKSLLKLPHQELHYPVIVSRSANQQANCIYVWHNEKKI